MTKYLKLARVTAWPGYSLAIVIPFAVGAYEGTNWISVLIGFTALFLFAGFAFALNFYSDRDTDRYHDGIQKDYNLSKQPMITGEITEWECKAFCVLTLLTAITLGFLVSSLFGIFIIFACLFGGILYSHPKIRMKAKPVGDIICISLLGVIVTSAAYILGAGELPTPLIMLLCFLITATGYTGSIMADYNFDLKAGLRTSAIYFGQSGSLKLMVVGCFLSIIVASFIFQGYYVMGTRYFAVTMTTGLIAITILAWISYKSMRLHIPVIFWRGHWSFITNGVMDIKEMLLRSLDPTEMRIRTLSWRGLRGFTTRIVIDIWEMLWRSLNPLETNEKARSMRGRWVFMTPVIISVAFLSYTAIKLAYGPYYLPWDPFLYY